MVPVGRSDLWRTIAGNLPPVPKRLTETKILGVHWRKIVPPYLNDSRADILDVYLERNRLLVPYNPKIALLDDLIYSTVTLVASFLFDSSDRLSIS